MKKAMLAATVVAFLSSVACASTDVFNPQFTFKTPKEAAAHCLEQSKTTNKPPQLSNADIPTRGSTSGIIDVYRTAYSASGTDTQSAAQLALAYAVSGKSASSIMDAYRAAYSTPGTDTQSAAQLALAYALSGKSASSILAAYRTAYSASGTDTQSAAQLAVGMALSGMTLTKAQLLRLQMSGLF